MDITLIQTLGAFEAIQPQWDELIFASDPGNVYATSMWIAATIRHLCSHEDIHIMCGWENGQLVAALPFLRRQRKVTGGLKLTSYRNVTGIYTGHFDFPVLNRDTRQLLVLWHDFIRTAGKWDEIELLYVRKDSMTYLLYNEISPQFSKHHKEEVYIGSDYVCEIQENWDAYFSMLKKKTKRHMVKMYNRMNKTSAYMIKKLSLSSDIDVYYNTAIALERKSWKGKIDSVRTRDYAPFIKEICKGALHGYRLHYYLLDIEGDNAAFLICPEIRGYVIAMVGGFSEAYKYFSPGKYLISHAIEEAHATHCRCIDLYHHSDAYKTDIVVTNPVPKYLLRLYNHTSRVFLYKLIDYLNKRSIELWKRSVSKVRAFYEKF